LKLAYSNSVGEKYHERAYDEISMGILPFSPAGFKQFDTFTGVSFAFEYWFGRISKIQLLNIQLHLKRKCHYIYYPHFGHQ
jgi:hypothetical protein